MVVGDTIFYVSFSFPTMPKGLCKLSKALLNLFMFSSFSYIWDICFFHDSGLITVICGIYVFSNVVRCFLFYSFS